MGRIFMRGALERLSPDIDVGDDARPAPLARLRPARAAHDDHAARMAFKFKHVLIREVAYAGLSKGARADLHQAFAELARRARR